MVPGDVPVLIRGGAHKHEYEDECDVFILGLLFEFIEFDPDSDDDSFDFACERQLSAEISSIGGTNKMSVFRGGICNAVVKQL